MKKKFFISVFCLVFISFFVIKPPEKAHADVVTTLVRVAAGSAGEEVIDGIAEKAGVNLFSKEARQKLVLNWNYVVKNDVANLTAQGDTADAQQIVNMNNQISQLTPASLGNDGPLWSKYILNTTAFLTGADIIYDVYANVKNAQTQASMMEVLGDYANGLATGEYSNTFGAYSLGLTTDGVSTTSYPNGRYLYYFVNGVRNTTSYGNFDISKPYVDYFVEKSGVLYLHRTYYSFSDGSYQAPTDFSFGNVSSLTQATNSDGSLDKFVPVPAGSVSPNLNTSSSDVMNKLKMPGVQTNQITVPANYPSTVQIEVPPMSGTTTNYDSNVAQTPWNDTFQDPSTTTSGSGSTTGSTTSGSSSVTLDNPTTDPNNTQNKWGQLVTEKFPFSLPWDIYNLLSCLVASPKVPVVDIDDTFTILGNSYEFKLYHKFDDFDAYAPFVRTFIEIGFALFLVNSTSRWLGGAR